MTKDYNQIDRVATLTIGDLTTNVGVKIQNLRIVFDILKTDDSKFNSGKIKVYNLSRENLLEFEQNTDKLGIILEAGYRDNYGPIFKAVVVGAHLEDDGRDNILVLIVADGTGIEGNPRFTASYKGKVEVWDLVTDIQQKMSEVSDLKQGVFFTQEVVAPYQNGFAWNNTCIKALDKVCEDRQLNWFIDNGRLNIVKRYTKLEEEVVYLSPETGLIGSPVFHEETNGRRKDKRKLRGVKAKCLINPNIKVGGGIKIKSEYFDGTYLVHKIDYSGDSYEGNWDMEIVGINETI